MNQQLHTHLAQKYAHAFLNVHGKAISFDDIHTMIRMVQFLREHKKIAFFLKLSAIDDAIKLERLTQLSESFSLPQAVISLIQLLLHHRRASILAHVLHHIVALFKQRANMKDVTIASAHELTKEQKVACEQFLARITGHDNIYTYMVDKELIAGVRVQSDTFLWEKSIAQQLRYLELALVH